MFKIRTIAAVLIALTLKSYAYSLGSGGLANQSGTSGKATGHGYAFAGVANDSSAIFFNPAGLTQVKGLNLMLGGSAVDFKSEHTSNSGTKDEMADNLPIAPYLYLSYSKEESPWAYGLGINSPFGLVTEWKDNSFSRYYATTSKLLMYNVNPTVSYAVSDKVSFGAGLDYFNVFETELNQRVFNLDSGLIPGSPTGDGHGKISGDGTGWGYNLGVLLKPSEKHSFGLAYRSQVNVVIEGEAELTELQDATAFAFGGSSYKSGVSTEFKFPQSVLLGYGFKPNDRWQIFADYEWVDWKIVENLDFNYERNNANLTQRIARDWKSTSNVGIGAEFKANNTLDLRFGVLAYESVVPSGTLEATLPDASRWGITFGPGFHFGNLSLDLNYQHIFLSDRGINNNAGSALASMDGEYEGSIDIIGMGLGYKWGGKS